jgi:hypothetical protein
MFALSQDCWSQRRQPLLWNDFADKPVARKWLCTRHVTAATQAATENLLEECFLCVGLETISRRLTGQMKQSLRLSHLGAYGELSHLKTAPPAGQNTPRCRKSSQAHTRPRVARSFQNSLPALVYNSIMQDKGRSNLKHVNRNAYAIGQGETKHKNYKRVKLESGQAYGRSVDWLQFQCSYIS